jgi:hypothetical protein
MRCWEALTKDRTWYEGLAAKSVLERTNNLNCGNFSHHQAEHWMRQLGLSKDDTEFWWMHDSVDQIHGDGSLNQLNSRAGFEPRSRPKGMLAPFGIPI